MRSGWKIVSILLAASGLLFIFLSGWIPAKAVVAQFLLQQAWQGSKVTGRIVKPWPWADTWPVGRLMQGRLGVDLIILEGESGEVLAFGPGHFPATGTPGTNKHCVLAGHRDTSFTFLRDLVDGDTIIVEGLTGEQRYKVMGRTVVRAEDLFLDRDNEGMLSLITCYPFRSVAPGTALRFLVTAILLP
jgi:sortase A